MDQLLSTNCPLSATSTEGAPNPAGVAKERRWWTINSAEHSATRPYKPPATQQLPCVTHSGPEDASVVPISEFSRTRALHATKMRARASQNEPEAHVLATTHQVALALSPRTRPSKCVAVKRTGQQQEQIVADHEYPVATWLPSSVPTSGAYTLPAHVSCCRYCLSSSSGTSRPIRLSTAVPHNITLREGTMTNWRRTNPTKDDESFISCSSGLRYGSPGRRIEKQNFIFNSDTNASSSTTSSQMTGLGNVPASLRSVFRSAATNAGSRSTSVGEGQDKDHNHKRTISERHNAATQHCSYHSNVDAGTAYHSVAAGNCSTLFSFRKPGSFRAGTASPLRLPQNTVSSAARFSAAANLSISFLRNFPASASPDNTWLDTAAAARKSPSYRAESPTLHTCTAVSALTCGSTENSTSSCCTSIKRCTPSSEAAGQSPLTKAPRGGDADATKAGFGLPGLRPRELPICLPRQSLATSAARYAGTAATSPVEARLPAFPPSCGAATSSGCCFGTTAAIAAAAPVHVVPRSNPPVQGIVLPSLCSHTSSGSKRSCSVDSSIVAPHPIFRAQCNISETHNCVRVGALPSRSPSASSLATSSLLVAEAHSTSETVKSGSHAAIRRLTAPAAPPASRRASVYAAGVSAARTAAPCAYVSGSCAIETEEEAHGAQLRPCGYSSMGHRPHLAGGWAAAARKSAGVVSSSYVLSASPTCGVRSPKATGNSHTTIEVLSCSTTVVGTTDDCGVHRVERSRAGFAPFRQDDVVSGGNFVAPKIGFSDNGIARVGEGAASDILSPSAHAVETTALRRNAVALVTSAATADALATPSAAANSCLTPTVEAAPTASCAAAASTEPTACSGYGDAGTAPRPDTGGFGDKEVTTPVASAARDCAGEPASDMAEKTRSPSSSSPEVFDAPMHPCVLIFSTVGSSVAVDESAPSSNAPVGGVTTPTSVPSGPTNTASISNVHAFKSAEGNLSPAALEAPSVRMDAGSAVEDGTRAGDTIKKSGPAPRGHSTSPLSFGDTAVAQWVPGCDSVIFSESNPAPDTMNTAGYSGDELVALSTDTIAAPDEEPAASCDGDAVTSGPAAVAPHTGNSAYSCDGEAVAYTTFAGAAHSEDTCGGEAVASAAAAVAPDYGNAVASCSGVAVADTTVAVAEQAEDMVAGNNGDSSATSVARATAAALCSEGPSATQGNRTPASAAAVCGAVMLGLTTDGPIVSHHDSSVEDSDAAGDDAISASVNVAPVLTHPPANISVKNEVLEAAAVRNFSEATQLPPLNTLHISRLPRRSAGPSAFASRHSSSALVLSPRGISPSRRAVAAAGSASLTCSSVKFSSNTAKFNRQKLLTPQCAHTHVLFLGSSKQHHKQTEVLQQSKQHSSKLQQQQHRGNRLHHLQQSDQLVPQQKHCQRQIKKRFASASVVYPTRARSAASPPVIPPKHSSTRERSRMPATTARAPSLSFAQPRQERTTMTAGKVAATGGAGNLRVITEGPPPAEAPARYSVGRVSADKRKLKSAATLAGEVSLKASSSAKARNATVTACAVATGATSSPLAASIAQSTITAGKPATLSMPASPESLADEETALRRPPHTSLSVTTDAGSQAVGPCRSSRSTGDVEGVLYHPGTFGETGNYKRKVLQSCRHRHQSFKEEKKVSQHQQQKEFQHKSQHRQSAQHIGMKEPQEARKKRKEHRHKPEIVRSRPLHIDGPKHIDKMSPNISSSKEGGKHVVGTFASKAATAARTYEEACNRACKNALTTSKESATTSKQLLTPFQRSGSRSKHVLTNSQSSITTKEVLSSYNGELKTLTESISLETFTPLPTTTALAAVSGERLVREAAQAPCHAEDGPQVCNIYEGNAGRNGPARSTNEGLSIYVAGEPAVTKAREESENKLSQDVLAKASDSGESVPAARTAEILSMNTVLSLVAGAAPIPAAVVDDASPKPARTAVLSRVAAAPPSRVSIAGAPGHDVELVAQREMTGGTASAPTACGVPQNTFEVINCSSATLTFSQCTSMASLEESLVAIVHTTEPDATDASRGVVAVRTQARKAMPHIDATLRDTHTAVESVSEKAIETRDSVAPTNRDACDAAVGKIAAQVDSEESSTDWEAGPAAPDSSGDAGASLQHPLPVALHQESAQRRLHRGDYCTQERPCVCFIAHQKNAVPECISTNVKLRNTLDETEIHSVGSQTGGIAADVIHETAAASAIRTCSGASSCGAACSDAADSNSTETDAAAAGLAHNTSNAVVTTVNGSSVTAAADISTANVLNSGPVPRVEASSQDSNTELPSRLNLNPPAPAASRYEKAVIVDEESSACGASIETEDVAHMNASLDEASHRQHRQAALSSCIDCRFPLLLGGDSGHSDLVPVQHDAAMLQQQEDGGKLATVAGEKKGMATCVVNHTVLNNAVAVGASASLSIARNILVTATKMKSAVAFAETSVGERKKAGTEDKQDLPALRGSDTEIRDVSVEMRSTEIRTAAATEKQAEMEHTASGKPVAQQNYEDNRDTHPLYLRSRTLPACWPATRRCEDGSSVSPCERASPHGNVTPLFFERVSNFLENSCCSNYNAEGSPCVTAAKWCSGINISNLPSQEPSGMTRRRLQLCSDLYRHSRERLWRSCSALSGGVPDIFRLPKNKHENTSKEVELLKGQGNNILPVFSARGAASSTDSSLDAREQRSSGAASARCNIEYLANHSNSTSGSRRGKSAPASLVNMELPTCKGRSCSRCHTDMPLVSGRSTKTEQQQMTLFEYMSDQQRPRMSSSEYLREQCSKVSSFEYRKEKQCSRVLPHEYMRGEDHQRSEVTPVACVAGHQRSKETLLFPEYEEKGVVNQKENTSPIAAAIECVCHSVSDTAGGRLSQVSASSCRSSFTEKLCKSCFSSVLSACPAQHVTEMRKQCYSNLCEGQARHHQRTPLGDNINASNAHIYDARKRALSVKATSSQARSSTSPYAAALQFQVLVATSINTTTTDTSPSSVAAAAGRTLKAPPSSSNLPSASRRDYSSGTALHPMSPAAIPAPEAPEEVNEVRASASVFYPSASPPVQQTSASATLPTQSHNAASAAYLSDVEKSISETARGDRHRAAEEEVQQSLCVVAPKTSSITSALSSEAATDTSATAAPSRCPVAGSHTSATIIVAGANDHETMKVVPPPCGPFSNSSPRDINNFKSRNPTERDVAAAEQRTSIMRVFHPLLFSQLLSGATNTDPPPAAVLWQQPSPVWMQQQLQQEQQQQLSPQGPQTRERQHTNRLSSIQQLKMSHCHQQKPSQPQNNMHQQQQQPQQPQKWLQKMSHCHQEKPDHLLIQRQFKSSQFQQKPTHTENDQKHQQPQQQQQQLSGERQLKSPHCQQKPVESENDEHQHQHQQQPEQQQPQQHEQQKAGHLHNQQWVMNEGHHLSSRQVDFYLYASQKQEQLHLLQQSSHQHSQQQQQVVVVVDPPKYHQQLSEELQTQHHHQQQPQTQQQQRQQQQNVDDPQMQQRQREPQRQQLPQEEKVLPQQQVQEQLQQEKYNGLRHTGTVHRHKKGTYTRLKLEQTLKKTLNFLQKQQSTSSSSELLLSQPPLCGTAKRWQYHIHTHSFPTSVAGRNTPDTNTAANISDILKASSVGANKMRSISNHESVVLSVVAGISEAPRRAAAHAAVASVAGGTSSAAAVHDAVAAPNVAAAATTPNTSARVRRTCINCNATVRGNPPVLTCGTRSNRISSCSPINCGARNPLIRGVSEGEFTTTTTRAMAQHNFCIQTEKSSPQENIEILRQEAEELSEATVRAAIGTQTETSSIPASSPINAPPTATGEVTLIERRRIATEGIEVKGDGGAGKKTGAATAGGTEGFVEVSDAAPETDEDETLAKARENAIPTGNETVTEARGPSLPPSPAAAGADGKLAEARAAASATTVESLVQATYVLGLPPDSETVAEPREVASPAAGAADDTRADASEATSSSAAAAAENHRAEASETALSPAGVAEDNRAEATEAVLSAAGAADDSGAEAREVSKPSVTIRRAAGSRDENTEEAILLTVERQQQMQMQTLSFLVQRQRSCMGQLCDSEHQQQQALVRPQTKSYVAPGTSQEHYKTSDMQRDKENVQKHSHSLDKHTDVSVGPGRSQISSETLEPSHSSSPRQCTRHHLQQMQQHPFRDNITENSFVASNIAETSCTSSMRSLLSLGSLEECYSSKDSSASGGTLLRKEDEASKSAVRRRSSRQRKRKDFGTKKGSLAGPQKQFESVLLPPGNKAEGGPLKSYARCGALTAGEHAVITEIAGEGHTTTAAEKTDRQYKGVKSALSDPSQPGSHRKTINSHGLLSASRKHEGSRDSTKCSDSAAGFEDALLTSVVKDTWSHKMLREPCCVMNNAAVEGCSPVAASHAADTAALEAVPPAASIAEKTNRTSQPALSVVSAGTSTTSEVFIPEREDYVAVNSPGVLLRRWRSSNSSCSTSTSVSHIGYIRRRRVVPCLRQRKWAALKLAAAASCQGFTIKKEDKTHQEPSLNNAGQQTHMRQTGRQQVQVHEEDGQLTQRQEQQQRLGDHESSQQQQMGNACMLPFRYAGKLRRLLARDGHNTQGSSDSSVNSGTSSSSTGTTNSSSKSSSRRRNGQKQRKSELCLIPQEEAGECLPHWNYENPPQRGQGQKEQVQQKEEGEEEQHEKHQQQEQQQQQQQRQQQKDQRHRQQQQQQQQGEEHGQQKQRHREWQPSRGGRDSVFLRLYCRRDKAAQMGIGWRRQQRLLADIEAIRKKERDACTFRPNISTSQHRVPAFRKGLEKPTSIIPKNCTASPERSEWQSRKRRLSQFATSPGATSDKSIRPISEAHQCITAPGVPAAGVPAAGVPAAGVATAGVATAGVARAGVSTAGVDAPGVGAAGVGAAGVAPAGVGAAGVGAAGVGAAGVATAGVRAAGVGAGGLTGAITRRAHPALVYSSTTDNNVTGFSSPEQGLPPSSSVCTAHSSVVCTAHTSACMGHSNVVCTDQCPPCRDDAASFRRPDKGYVAPSHARSAEARSNCGVAACKAVTGAVAATSVDSHCVASSASPTRILPKASVPPLPITITTGAVEGRVLQPNKQRTASTFGNGQKREMLRSSSRCTSSRLFPLCATNRGATAPALALARDAQREYEKGGTKYKSLSSSKRKHSVSSSRLTHKANMRGVRDCSNTESSCTAIRKASGDHKERGEYNKSTTVETSTRGSTRGSSFVGRENYIRSTSTSLSADDSRGKSCLSEMQNYHSSTIKNVSTECKGGRSSSTNENYNRSTSGDRTRQNKRKSNISESRKNDRSSHGRSNIRGHHWVRDQGGAGNNGRNCCESSCSKRQTIPRREHRQSMSRHSDSNSQSMQTLRELRENMREDSGSNCLSRQQRDCHQSMYRDSRRNSSSSSSRSVQPREHHQRTRGKRLSSSRSIQHRECDQGECSHSPSSSRSVEHKEAPHHSMPACSRSNSPGIAYREHRQSMGICDYQRTWDRSDNSRNSLHHLLQNSGGSSGRVQSDCIEAAGCTHHTALSTVTRRCIQQYEQQLEDEWQQHQQEKQQLHEGMQQYPPELGELLGSSAADTYCDEGQPCRELRATDKVQAYTIPGSLRASSSVPFKAAVDIRETSAKGVVGADLTHRAPIALPPAVVSCETADGHGKCITRGRISMSRTAAPYELVSRGKWEHLLFLAKCSRALQEKFDQNDNMGEQPVLHKNINRQGKEQHLSLGEQQANEKDRLLCEKATPELLAESPLLQQPSGCLKILSRGSLRSGSSRRTSQACICSDEHVQSHVVSSFNQQNRICCPRYDDESFVEERAPESSSGSRRESSKRRTNNTNSDDSRNSSVSLHDRRHRLSCSSCSRCISTHSRGIFSSPHSSLTRLNCSSGRAGSITEDSNDGNEYRREGCGSRRNRSGQEERNIVSSGVEQCIRHESKINNSDEVEKRVEIYADKKCAEKITENFRDDMQSNQSSNSETWGLKHISTENGRSDRRGQLDRNSDSRKSNRFGRNIYKVREDDRVFPIPRSSLVTLCEYHATPHTAVTAENMSLSQAESCGIVQEGGAKEFYDTEAPPSGMHRAQSQKHHAQYCAMEQSGQANPARRNRLETERGRSSSCSLPAAATVAATTHRSRRASAKKGKIHLPVVPFLQRMQWVLQQRRERLQQQHELPKQCQQQRKQLQLKKPHQKQKPRQQQQRSCTRSQHERLRSLQPHVSQVQQPQQRTCQQHDQAQQNRSHDTAYPSILYPSSVLTTLCTRISSWPPPLSMPPAVAASTGRAPVASAVGEPFLSCSAASPMHSDGDNNCKRSPETRERPCNRTQRSKRSSGAVIHQRHLRSASSGRSFDSCSCYSCCAESSSSAGSREASVHEQDCRRRYCCNVRNGTRSPSGDGGCCHGDCNSQRCCADAMNPSLCCRRAHAATWIEDDAHNCRAEQVDHTGLEAYAYRVPKEKYQENNIKQYDTQSGALPQQETLQCLLPRPQKQDEDQLHSQKEEQQQLPSLQRIDMPAMQRMQRCLVNQKQALQERGQLLGAACSDGFTSTSGVLRGRSSNKDTLVAAHAAKSRHPRYMEPTERKTTLSLQPSFSKKQRRYASRACSLLSLLRDKNTSGLYTEHLRMKQAHIEEKRRILEELRQLKEVEECCFQPKLYRTMLRIPRGTRAKSLLQASSTQPVGATSAASGTAAESDTAAATNTATAEGREALAIAEAATIAAAAETAGATVRAQTAATAASSAAAAVSQAVESFIFKHKGGSGPATAGKQSNSNPSADPAAVHVASLTDMSAVEASLSIKSPLSDRQPKPQVTPQEEQSRGDEDSSRLHLEQRERQAKRVEQQEQLRQSP